ncbi:MAG: hypothetical protein ABI763_14545 [Bacteroidota bacterium]
MKLKLLALLLFLFVNCNAQYDPEGSDNFYKSTSRYNYRFKFTAYVFVTGEWGLSLGFSNWITYTRLQPSENFSINAHFGKNNLGNRNKPYNKWQLNVISSTFLTYAFSNSVSQHYDEINPFYFGNSSGAFQNYKHSITLGSSFVALPKGIGRNVVTPRNRSQQLVYLQVKTGDFQINVYEDYLVFTDNKFFGMLADNRDRFYTGGGNVQVRINKNLIAKYYTEIYTGNSYPDQDDYPDFVDVSDTTRANFFSHMYGTVGPKRPMKYAYQDPGQNMFNRGRNFIALQMSSRIFTGNNQTLVNPHYTNDNFQVMAGLHRGVAEMWQQNLIHSLNTVDKDLPPDKCGVIKADRLHLFKPFQPRYGFWRRLTGGVSFTSDFVANDIADPKMP